MSWWIWVLLGVIALAVFGWYLSNVAGRLDRLHKKIDTAELALQAQLANRTSVCLELAGSGLLDPASSLLIAEAAHDARIANDHTRDVAESDLTAVLVATFEDPEDVTELQSTPEGEQMLEDLTAACKRVELSRIFLNDAVVACLKIRNRPLVRALSLAGHTPYPSTWEMNDTVPAALTG